MMSLHKLTAGDGYTYLTRQVAALDATSKGHVGLDAYYSEKGESPGQWLGSGLAGLDGIEAGDEVTAEHMRALFGEGRHPDADAIERKVVRAGGTVAEALAASMLGRRFPVFDGKTDYRTVCGERFGEHNAALGLPRDWPVPAEDRASIRTQVGREMFAEKFGRDAADPRELAGFITRASRPATTAVAGYDLTFSPVKSVSTLWAVAPREVAEQIEAAHQAAVTDTVRWIEEQASYTRTGAGGVRQVDIQGLLATAFTHRDARSGDPDLHTHVAISNKVQTASGKWLALDGRVLHKATVAASERYNTRLEAEVTKRLGAAFAERPGADARKRPVREIVGVDERLNTRWSSRRASIDIRRAQLMADFQTRQGRPPTAVEAIKLAQQATLETRQAKHEPRSFAAQREAWRADALTVLDGEAGLSRMVRRALNPKAGKRMVVDDAWVQAASEKVIGVVEESRATWQMWHVRAEAERFVRGAGVAPGDVERAVEAVVTIAVSPARSIRLGAPDPVLEPAALRRKDGASVYTVAGTQLMTSAEIVAAEKSLVGHASRTGGRWVTQATVDLALLESTANGMSLNAAQAQMVADLATSTARLQLAIAPAGSGKTTAMRVLARAWSDEGGQVIGLAPTAVAAAVLGQEIDSRSDTLAKLNWALTSGFTPSWVEAIGPKTLVIIDEAGMSGTLDLAQAADFVIARGGSVRLVGDDQQLASIAAGGVLRDIAETAGVSTLSELVRFSDPTEGAATLGLRAGDSEALGFYLDNGRVRVGDEATMADQAYQAWLADRVAGHDAVMLAPTRDLVSTLNIRAREDRLAAAGGVLEGPERTLSDGNAASAGDVVVSRANERTLPITSSDWVKNGDRWTIEAVHQNGDLQVKHLRLGRTITMPAQYVGDHVELGYASTVHGAQGLTADRCHVIATGSESRQLFYVAMSRGRHSNSVYLTVVGDGDPHNIIRPETISAATPTEILTAILDRDQAQKSATTTSQELSSPQVQLGEATGRYRDALGFAAEDVVGPQVLAALDTTAEQVRPGLSECAAYGTLRAHLAIISLSGADPHQALLAAAGHRELNTALDPAAVLDWRLDTTGGHSAGTGPLPWLPGVPTALGEHPQWGQYLSARTARVSDLAEQVAIDAATFTPDTAPEWAVRLAGPEHRQVRVDVAVWRAAMGVQDSDRRPTGRPQMAIAVAKYQGNLAARAVAATGGQDANATIWAPIADEINSRIKADPHWPDVADRLASLQRTGIDAAQLLRAVAAGKDLPDDLPAAALWWRMAQQLSAADQDAGTGSAPAPGPVWADALAITLGPARANRVMLDPDWPALVAAVTRAEDLGWTAEQILAAAAERTYVELLPADGGVRDDDLTRALASHVHLLSDAAPVIVAPATDDEPSPSEPEGDLPDRDFLAGGAGWTLTGPHTLLAAASSDGDTVRAHAPDAPPVPDHGEDPDLEDDGRLPSPEVVRARLETATVDRLVTTQLFGYEAAPSSARLGLDAAPVGDSATGPQVNRARVVDLNARAAQFYTVAAEQSWVPDYLLERLGAAATDARFTAGYAPTGWTTLVDHLQADGASSEELLAAGLARRARTGAVIDVFRDRLVIPLRDGQDIVGFTARRNPAHDDSEQAGPKYLNTGHTACYDKSSHLFGLTEATATGLLPGARPVLVEGPFDAWAVTAATGGTHFGIATLGTSLTDPQADQLLPYIGAGQPGVVVATDPDAAGAAAAERAYWALTTRRDNPDHLGLPDGIDPAEYLTQHGPHALTTALDEAGPLADALIGRHSVGRDAWIEDRVWALRQCARVVAALPPDLWPARIEQLVDHLDVIPEVASGEVTEAATKWTTHLRQLSTFAAHRTGNAAVPSALPSEPEMPGSAPRRRRSLASRLDDTDPELAIGRRQPSPAEPPEAPRRPDRDRPAGPDIRM